MEPLSGGTHLRQTLTGGPFVHVADEGGGHIIRARKTGSVPFAPLRGFPEIISDLPKSLGDVPDADSPEGRSGRPCAPPDGHLLSVGGVCRLRGRCQTGSVPFAPLRGFSRNH